MPSLHTKAARRNRRLSACCGRWWVFKRLDVERLLHVLPRSCAYNPRWFCRRVLLSVLSMFLSNDLVWLLCNHTEEFVSLCTHRKLLSRSSSGIQYRLSSI